MTNINFSDWEKRLQDFWSVAQKKVPEYGGVAWDWASQLQADNLIDGLITTGIYSDIRSNRSVAVGWKEQKFLVTLQSISSLNSSYMFVNKNLERMGVDFFQGFFAGAAVSLFANAVPIGLHLLSNRLGQPVANIAELEREKRVNQNNWYSFNDKWDGFDDEKKEDYIKLGAGSKMLTKDELSDLNTWARVKTALKNKFEAKNKDLIQRIEAEKAAHYKNTEAVVNFCYLHLNDVGYVANLATTIASIYLGVGVAVNSFQLAVLMLGLLEQGFFWIDPKESNGPLYAIGNGALVRSYQPLIGKLNSYLLIPYQFVAGGYIGKALATYNAYHIAPQFAKNGLSFAVVKTANGLYYCSPKFIKSYIDLAAGAKQATQEAFAEQVGGKNVVLEYPSDNTLSFAEFVAMVENGANKKWTTKVMGTVEYQDWYPEQTLNEISSQVLAKINDLTDDDKKRRLKAVHERLFNAYNGTANKVLQDQLGPLIKSTFGKLNEDFEKHFGIFLENQNKLNCEAITVKTMQEIYFHMIEVSSLESGINLVLQSRRDLSFSTLRAQHLEAASKQYKKAKEKSSIAMQKGWQALRSWQFNAEVALIPLFLVTYLQSSYMVNAINILETNAHGHAQMVTLFGEGLGLSDYTNAHTDTMRQMGENEAGLNTIKTLYAPLGQAVKSHFYPRYFDGRNAMYAPDLTLEEELVSVIALAEDERIEEGAFFNYLNEICKDDKEVENFLTLGILNATDSEKKAFLRRHLPYVLYRLGYVNYSPIEAVADAGAAGVGVPAEV